jgi:hypothetical protein
MAEQADDSWIAKLFVVLFLGSGIAIFSASLFFVPVDFLGYTGFALLVDLVMAIPFVGYTRELWLDRRMI